MPPCLISTPADALHPCHLPQAQALVSLTALETLDACGNQLKRGGACALAKACARKPGLQLLALDENELSDSGIEALKVGASVAFSS